MNSHGAQLFLNFHAKRLAAAPPAIIAGITNFNSTIQDPCIKQCPCHLRPPSSSTAKHDMEYVISRYTDAENTHYQLWNRQTLARCHHAPALKPQHKPSNHYTEEDGYDKIRNFNLYAHYFHTPFYRISAFCALFLRTRPKDFRDSVDRMNTENCNQRENINDTK